MQVSDKPSLEISFLQPTRQPAWPFAAAPTIGYCVKGARGLRGSKAR